MAPDAAGPAEEKHRASLLRRRQRLVYAERITIDRRISVDLRELELGDRTAEIVEGDWRARLHMSKHAREELPIVLARVEAAQDLVPNVVIVTGEVEAGGLDPLRGRNERLRREQVRQVREAGSFRGREDETGAIAEWVSGQRVEARVPHQCRIESGIDRHRRAALVARSLATRSHEEVVVDADRDRLRIAEAIRWRVAAAACVVVVQALDRIEPKLASNVGELPIDAPAEPRLECARDPTGESQARKLLAQRGIDVLGDDRPCRG